MSLNLGHKILPGRVAIGAYDGKLPVLTAATNGERVSSLRSFLPQIFAITCSHVISCTCSKILLLELLKPISQSKGKTLGAINEDITFLNINQPITCLKTGPLEKNSDRSFLFVGTLSNMFGYDVENNKDLFYKEVWFPCKLFPDIETLY